MKTQSNSAYTGVLHAFDEVTSTNDVLLDMATQGTEDFTAVAARVQTAGRGRQGRAWATIPGQSIACSVLVRGAAHQHLPLVAAIALSDTLREAPGTSIKWPNDMLLNQQKIAGILVERHVQGSEPFYIVGFGVNVGEMPLDFAAQHPKATTLAVVHHYDRDILRTQMLSALEKRVNQYRNVGFAPLADIYTDRCSTFGQQISWQQTSERTITGHARALNSDGALILVDGEGRHHTINSGEIVAQASSPDAGNS